MDQAYVTRAELIKDRFENGLAFGTDDHRYGIIWFQQDTTVDADAGYTSANTLIAGGWPTIEAAIESAKEALGLVYTLQDGVGPLYAHEGGIVHGFTIVDLATINDDDLAMLKVTEMYVAW